MKNTSSLISRICYLIGLLAACLAYLFFDIPIANFIKNEKLDTLSLFHMLIYIPNATVYILSIIFLVLIVKRKTISKVREFDKMLLAALMSGFISVAIVSFFKIIFGRTGPLYWLNHPAEYGFHLFKGLSPAFQDFPSGHTAGIFAIYTTLFFAGKYRTLFLLLSLFTVFGLVATHSHFLSDCIVGAMLGAFIGKITADFFQVSVNSYPPPAKTGKKQPWWEWTKIGKKRQLEGTS